MAAVLKEIELLEPFLISTGVVALAEIGDKTQLLSLVLAARYRKPLPIVLGVLAATLADNAFAGGIGTLLANLLSPRFLNWAIVVSFVLMAGWILIPEKPDGSEFAAPKHAMGILGTTFVTFFVAEMGDKTQVATIALAARFHDFFQVVGGTTLGMMVANVPVIYLGSRFANRLPAKVIHIIAAILFLVLGALALEHALSGTPVPG